MNRRTGCLVTAIWLGGVLSTKGAAVQRISRCAEIVSQAAKDRAKISLMLDGYSDQATIL
jgi:hypothetical protein